MPWFSLKKKKKKFDKKYIYGCLPLPRPVEKQRKMTILMSSPSWIQILFMIRMICNVSMSCRRSSPA